MDNDDDNDDDDDYNNGTREVWEEERERNASVVHFVLIYSTATSQLNKSNRDNSYPKYSILSFYYKKSNPFCSPVNCCCCCNLSPL